MYGVYSEVASTAPQSMRDNIPAHVLRQIKEDIENA